MASTTLRTLTLGLAAGVAACAGSSAPRVHPVIPAPAVLQELPGEFELDDATAIVLGDPGDAEMRRVAEMWAEPVRTGTGLPLPIAEAGSIAVGLSADVPAEGYRLSVDREGISLEAGDHAGLFYGLQTLSQLIAAAPDATRPRLAAMAIEDAPRFPYRGMHLDVGRHFFGPDFVKRYIDHLAHYKINRFHWHLTEDQGWRIQIDRYPRLTEVGAWRSETMVEKNFDPYVGDGTPYGGFYTKDEVRDIVAYAQERFVTVVPEIEMPGHSLAALAAYPELACTEGPFEVGTRWGVEEDIYCPKEETFEFLENVLLEVMELFPGEYIHIGGDEAPKARWEESEFAQAVIEREGLADEFELQSWFIRRIEAFLAGHGRSLIGWDEILEGGLAPNATVMSWRGIEGGVEAARQGHDVIMTPTSHMYFDYYQGDPETEPLAIGGFLPLEQVYHFEPVPDVLGPEEARHVIGAQANLWTEYVRTEEYAEYMLFPRLFALSEVAWSAPEVRDFDRFVARLPWHLDRLDLLGASYRIPDVVGLDRNRTTIENDVRIELTAPARGEIRYTLDASEPGAASRLYTKSFEVDVEHAPVTVSARIVTPAGRLGPSRSATFSKAVPRPAAMVDETTLEEGMRVELMEGRFRDVSRLARETVVRRESMERVEMPAWVPEENFALRFRGYVSVPEDGVYLFRLTSDDGSVLRMGNRVVIDHDGPHTMSAKEQDVALARGIHPFEVLYFQAGGGKGISLEIEGPPSDRGGPLLMRVR